MAFKVGHARIRKLLLADSRSFGVGTGGMMRKDAERCVLIRMSERFWVLEQKEGPGAKPPALQRIWQLRLRNWQIFKRFFAMLITDAHNQALRLWRNL
jgi:hypothetical protein